MRKIAPVGKTVSPTKNEAMKIHQKDSDGRIRVKAVNEMKSQLERVKNEFTKKKNDIQTVEFFLNKLAEPSNEKNRELEEIIEKENKNLLEKFTRLKETCNLRQKIKDIRSRPMFVIEAALLFQLSLLIFFVVFDFDSIQQNPQVDTEPGKVLKSKYLIQNLKGDTTNTWVSWRLTDGDTLHVNVVNGYQYPEKLEIIQNAILSTDTIEINDSLLHKSITGSTSLFYLGWVGALESVSQEPTSFYIPAKIEIENSTSGAGDITIRLATERNADGFSGYTRSIVDENQNQILKSEIIIYDINSLSDNQLSTIVKHEFGHALGLAHSTDPRDLMHSVVYTAYPYISECNLDAIKFLYDDGKSSQVVCEK